MQKKLEELESVLKYSVFSLAANSPCSQLVLQDINQKFVFLKNLLSAEIASHPSKPHHLHHIEHRLARLESDFNGWDGRFKTSALNNILDDTASTCSCTESGLNDDGEASDDGDDDLGSLVLYEEEDDEPAGRLSSGLMVENNALVEFRGDMKHESDQLQDQELYDCPVEEKAKEEIRVEMESEKEVKGEERRVAIGSLFGAMTTGVVLGMTLIMGYVMGKFSAGCFLSVEPGTFLIPT